jgi:hypothetical protein
MNTLTENPNCGRIDEQYVQATKDLGYGHHRNCNIGFVANYLKKNVYVAELRGYVWDSVYGGGTLIGYFDSLQAAKEVLAGIFETDVKCKPIKRLVSFTVIEGVPTKDDVTINYPFDIMYNGHEGKFIGDEGF